MRRPIVIGALIATLITSGAGSCDKLSPCQVEGERVRGGAPRADSQECKDRQERARKAKVTPTKKK